MSRRSVHSGGPATINGILYQMLWSLLRTTTLEVNDPSINSDGDAIEAATLILEPSDGGDVRVQGSGLDRVQQLKAKSDQGPWSLRSVVKDVLPDLYKATNVSRPRRFELITEGYRGKWNDVYDFFKSLQNRRVPKVDTTVLDALDDTNNRKFAGSLTAGSTGPSRLSDRALFVAISQLVCPADPGSQAESKNYRRLWNLLAHFEFIGGQTHDTLDEQLRQKLLPAIDVSEDYEKIRDAMLTDLLRRASHGNTTVSRDEFLRSHGVTGIGFQVDAWKDLLVRSADRLQIDLCARDYRADESIWHALGTSEIDDWQSGATPYIALVGTNGQEKTWSLCALADTVAYNVPTLLVRSIGTAEADLTKIEDLVWHGLWGRDSASPPLYRIADRVPEGFPDPWLSICIDGVETAEHAGDLVDALVHSRGVRVAIATSPALLGHLHGETRGRIKAYHLPELSAHELREFVAMGDQATWKSIPEDVRSILRFPTLASRYRDLSSDGSWSPTYEYVLVHQYYTERLVSLMEDEYPTSILAMNRLSVLMWARRDLTLTIEDLVNAGHTDASIRHLLHIGWLVRVDSGLYRVWLDRMCNWQIAEMLANSIRSGESDASDVGERCAEILWSNPFGRPHRLGYVPMDLVWLLMEQCGPEEGSLNLLLRKLEVDYQSVRGLYRGFAPTLGSGIVPALFRRLAETEGEDDWEVRASIEEALKEMDGGAIPDGAAIRLLENEDSRLRRSGARILRAHPSARAIEPLWQRYCALHSDAAAKANLVEYAGESDDLVAAIRACAPYRPEWVDATIRCADASLCPLGPVALLLSDLEDGSDLWLTLKGILGEKLKGGDEWYYASQVYHWRDTAEIGWLRDHHIPGEHIGVRCFAAMVRIEPDVALDTLAKLEPSAVNSMWGYPIGALVIRSPEKASRCLADQMSQHPDDISAYLRHVSGLLDWLPIESVESLLDIVGDRMPHSSPRDLWWAFEALGQARSLKVLRTIGQRRGTQWESDLTAMLLERSAMPGQWHDSMLSAAATVLYRVGGDGFTNVVNRWLEADDPFARMSGLLEAAKRPDATTIRLLKGIATDSALAKQDSLHPRLAAEALGLAGQWKAVVEHLIVLGTQSSADLVEAGADQKLSDDEIAPALHALKADPEHPGAFVALGFAQRADFVTTIVESLDKAEPHSELSDACIVALGLMPSLPPEAIEALKRDLDDKQAHRIVINTLCADGSDRAARALLDFVREDLPDDLVGGIDTGFLHLVIHSVGFVLDHEETREEAVKFCRERLDRGDAIDYVAQQLVLSLARFVPTNEGVRDALDSDRVREFLADFAFQADGSFRYVGHKANAIRALAAFDREEGYRAALLALQNPAAHDREYMPYILLEVDAERAVGDLIAYIVGEPTCSFPAVVARALRDKECEGQLIPLLKSAGASSRRAACFALGFCAPSMDIVSSVRECLDDDDVSVYEAACHAVRRLHETEIVDQLVDAYLAECERARRWILLDAALETGDLGNEHRPAPWIVRMCAEMPSLLQTYVAEKMEKRRKQIASDLENADKSIRS